MKTLKTPTKRQSLIECLALCVVAVLLRAWFIGKTDLGYDESYSLHAALQNIPDLVRMLCQGDNPPLWELLLHFWVKIFGISEIAIRSLSLIFSALTIIPIYLIGEKYLHRFAGIAASLCYCFSTFSIYMAHECRVYSLIACCSACSVGLFISAVHQPKPFKFILLTLTNLMLMYGHYLSVWIIVMEFLIALMIRPIRQKIWKPYLIHAAALIVLFTPMFPVLFHRFMESGMNGTWIAKTTSLEALYDFLWRMCNVPVTTVLAISILLSSFILLTINIIKKKITITNTGILTLLWAVPLLVSFVLSYFTGFFLDRYFYFLFPIFYLSIVAYCLQLFKKHKSLGISLMTLFSVAMTISCSPDSSTKRFSGWHYNVKTIATQLINEKENENALIVLPENFEKQFTYYLDENHEAFRTHSQPSSYYVFHDYLSNEGYFYDNNYPNANLNDYGKVVFTYRKATPISGLEKYLETNGFHLEKRLDMPPYEVCHYHR